MTKEFNMRVIQVNLDRSMKVSAEFRNVMMVEKIDVSACVEGKG